ncbi:PREDICTED: putative E3 ubiquitin-protein ligase LIN isoform X3 [Populus euphratica]|uniref:E3 ubiquitin-protein ligase LIN isoform X3 n=1 Tax=Populus euphratica TaxID=75702 RepID=A0AAJ6SZ53_POPEU|nr:PREDICTED: putative E3 ubiquitin-protein ligase LIN isoform X3 [Populus euphratica]
MASLHQMLSEEGFEHRKFLRSRDRLTRPEESVILPLHNSHDQKRFQSPKQKTDMGSTRKGSSIFSSRRVNSDSERLQSKSLLKGEEPAIDVTAIRAVVSILSGYIGRYIKDVSFREMIREKCNSCLVRRSKGSDDGIFVNMEVAMESIEKLVEEKAATRKEVKMESLKNSIQLLNIVASLNSKKSRKGSTCGVPNSHLSACAQLYLAIVYKLEKNDRISARHLLYVFCDSPFLARAHLLPDIWEHFLLPHLLHLKVWYHEELEALSDSQHVEEERRMKALSKVYNDRMDMGTIQFALYYNEWLKVGAKAPTVPAVPLPSIPSYATSMRRTSDSYKSRSSINTNFRYRAVFGPTLERQSKDFDFRNRASMDTWSIEEDKVCIDEYKDCSYATNNKTRTTRRQSSQNYAISNHYTWHEPLKSELSRPFTCQNVSSECLGNGNIIVRSNSIRNEETTHLPPIDLSRTISTICSSDSLTECETAIRVTAKAWLDSIGSNVIAGALSKAPVIEGLLEFLFASTDDEVLELAISILAELVVRNEANRLIVLNSDPQLKIFMKLLRSNSLFLKVAVLLYLLKPKAKQMISLEWVALVLRVLEFGGQLQTLFTVRCMPEKAAMYFLGQLLTGFDEERNLENASQVVALGGLSFLVRTFEIGDIIERNHAATLMLCCIRANGSSRNYLAENLNKDSILQLIVLGIQKKFKGYVFTLLADLLCLSRRTWIIKFLTGLCNGWGGLNTMHIFLVYLQRASPEERPLVAAVLLQLDLMGDLSQSNLYREEAVEAITESLECHNCSTKVQEQSAKALLMLGGCFSYSGEASAEEWLLRQAGFHERLRDSFQRKEIVDGNLNEEEDAMEDWQGKVAVVLLNSGGKRFLSALSNSIVNGIPILVQSSLVTVAWMRRILLPVRNENSYSTITPRLTESPHYDRALNGRMNPSFSQRHLIKNSESLSMLSTLNKELIDPLRNLYDMDILSAYLFNQHKQSQESRNATKTLTT